MKISSIFILQCKALYITTADQMCTLDVDEDGIPDSKVNSFVYISADDHTYIHILYLLH